MHDHLPQPRREQALPVARPTRAGLMALQSAAGNRAMGRLLSVQRNVGIELEDSKWSVVTDTRPRKRVDKGVPIAVRDEFQLQAEDAGTGSVLEIVSHPPGVMDPGGLEALIRQIGETITQLDKRATGKKFRALKLKDGCKGFLLESKDPFTPFAQVTVGVPLARIPQLFAALTQARAAVVQGPKDSWPHQAAERIVDSPSPDLTGLIHLLRSYLVAGDRGDSARTLKGLVRAMSRTDFATLFTMIPADEQRVIRDRQELWVAALTDELAMGGDDRASAPVFSQHLRYDNKGITFGHRNHTSRRDWLEGMSARGVDLLTARGKAGFLEGGERAESLRAGIEWAPPKMGPAQLLQVLEEIHEGLGALGPRVDQVAHRDEPESTPAAIIELREIPDGLDWRVALRRIYQCVHDVISQEGQHPFSYVRTADGEARRRAAGKLADALSPEKKGS
ncbi:hypothetical protein GCM10011609_30530 [Lentzea pudingi]|uniref:Uncharacterized protein n=1 Tax=Lentzea pudingi TaxID=1789439 RepID=A0ABQ2HVS3_9PSEU|nr:hypothetical protein [Lentzea pudingi]GGM91236.1 hypothetical protein GCM10011609_30530 [Lentzea pudingi]